MQETSRRARPFVPCRFRVFLDAHTFPTEHQLILHRVHGTDGAHGTHTARTNIALRFRLSSFHVATM